MRRERIRATPSWRRSTDRYDCVFVVTDPAEHGMRSLHVARVKLLFSIKHAGVVYPCALVEWFERVSDEPDGRTNMWVVEPDLNMDGSRNMSVIHLDSIFRLAHLIPEYGEESVPVGLKPSDSLDAFLTYFVNKFADHHAHTIAY
ncbi:uncharacterized protein B0H18DRAFT_1086831 [Fomitopsis serialis]|uniref:uncharacterized protein n=1 Tax=Fomitopsis serialis TaxID=139415 RepID=UPI0020080E01|nr:uncharacterized protein B0H18DRAFT_1086831 [Neoantrodia serialis]KAH9918435.1 hypothetical protein B0H18DRAFT_1086831 [Neoantrodia serialis]